MASVCISRRTFLPVVRAEAAAPQVVITDPSGLAEGTWGFSLNGEQ